MTHQNGPDSNQAPVSAPPRGRRRSRKLLVGLPAVGVVIAAVAVYVARGPEERRWNCVLVTFDTTRADHLSCYGYKHVETPTLDRMARHGIRYGRCYSPAPLTLPAHASILTGCYPFYHGLRDNGVGPLDDDALTLAEILRQHGYQTGAVVGAYVLDSRYGLNQGFDFYEDDLSGVTARSKFQYAQRNAQAVTEAALHWLDGLADDEPFFLWVHYFDPHSPYEPPGYKAATATATAYDAEIAYADGQLDRLLQRIGRIKQATGREMLIVFAGDHGESLWDHGEPTHGLFAYDDTLHVPLIVYVPSAAQRGLVIDTLVSLVDIFPSVLEWLDVPRPHQVHGRVLPISSGATAGPEPERCVYFETYGPYNIHGWSPLEGVLVGGRKYIAAPKQEFYDLVNDPEEMQNLFSPDDPRVMALQGALANLKDAGLGYPPLVAGQPDTDLASRRKLQSLGYIGTIVQPQEVPASLADPKDKVELHRDVLQAQSEIENQSFAKALQLLTHVIQTDPNSPRTLFLLMDLLNEAEVSAETLVVLRRRLEQPLPPPFDASLPLGLAIALGNQGRMDEAEELLRRSLDASPGDAEANFYLGRALGRDSRRLQAALTRFQDAHRLDPRNRDYAVALAQWYEQLGDYEAAQETYEDILQQHPDDPTVLNNSAWVYHKLQRRPELAQERSRRAVAIQPSDPHLHHTLGCILLDAGQIREAASHLSKAIEMAPGFAEAHYHLGIAWQRQGERAGAIESLGKAIEAAPATAPDWVPDAEARLKELRSR